VINGQVHEEPPTLQLKPAFDGIAIDSMVVTCRKDLRLLNVMLQSYHAFSRIGGSLFIFYDPGDRDTIESMALPRGTVLIDKSSVPGTRGDGYRDQMLIKLSIDQYSAAEYVWALDSDFLLVSPVSNEDFFYEGKPVWVYRDWDNAAGLAWREPTEALLGKPIPYQFMDRPQYLLSTSILAELRDRISLDGIYGSAFPPSEYILYAGFCYSTSTTSYHWARSGDPESNFSYCVNQRPPTYMILDPDASLSEAGNSKVLALWSHWEFAEDKMREFLTSALARDVEARVKQLKVPFYTPMTPSEIQNGFGSVAGQFDDGWLKSRIRFSLASKLPSTLLIEVDAIYTPDCSIRCDLTVNGARNSMPLVTGTNQIRIDLQTSGAHHIAIDMVGGIREPGGIRILSARFVSSSIVELCGHSNPTLER
jgi:hypothetical protein